MKETDLTLAICMYNAERYIKETLNCVMAQTMQNFNLLIVNDCSTDGSVACVEQFFTEHTRQYELVNLPVNRGLCAGRRYVEENTTTKYILFVDADDCPLPNLVEKLYRKISSDSDLIAVGCYQSFIDAEGKPLRGGIFLGETTKEGFYEKARKEKLIFMQPTAVYDRKAALSVGGHQVEGFPESKPRYQDLCEDLDLWTRMSDLYVEGKAIIVLPEILCNYRKHEKALSANSLGMILRMRQIKVNLKRRRCGEHELSFIDFCNSLSVEEYRKLTREAKSADALRTAYYGLRKGNMPLCLRSIYVSIKNNPGYIIDKVKHNLLRMK